MFLLEDVEVLPCSFISVARWEVRSSNLAILESLVVNQNSFACSI